MLWSMNRDLGVGVRFLPVACHAQSRVRGVGVEGVALHTSEEGTNPDTGIG